MSRAAGSGIVQRFLAFLRTYELSGQTVGIAFSGGPDSTALGIVASEAARAGLLQPVAIHVDHGVRADSALDLTTIRHSCAALGLELRSLTAQLPSNASEDRMRIERFRLLSSAIAEHGGDQIMTAHHADDQAETVLLHLIRGSGLEGVAGMAAVDRWSAGSPAPGLTVIRPFLLETRAELRQLVKDRGLPFVVDPTNEDRDKARNLMRLEVLPNLEAIHPGAGSAIARFAETAGHEDSALDRVVAGKADQYIFSGELLVRQLSGEPVAIQRRLIRHWVRERTGLVLSWNRTEAVRAMSADGDGGTMVELGEGWTAIRRGALIRLSHGKAGSEG